MTTLVKATKTELTTVQKLEKFVNQRSGIDWRNYYSCWADKDGVKAFRQERAEITKARKDFYSLFNLAIRRIGEAKLNEQLTAELSKTSGRLTLSVAGELEYCTGQYWPTEYRPAASRILATIIWHDFVEEKLNKTNAYKTANDVRAAIKKHVSHRVMKNYFN